MPLPNLRSLWSGWKPRPTILQASPPRSGSTLVFNLLCELFPNHRVRKDHGFKHWPVACPVVVTYRHPLDCIASSIQRYGLSPTDEVVDSQVAEFQKAGFEQLRCLRHEPQALLLRYERFVADFGYLFDELARFFQIEIPPPRRAALASQYHVENISQLVAQKTSFAEFDPQTHWHGRHISRFKGQPYYFREFFTPAQIERLLGIYGPWLQEFGYPEPTRRP